MLKKLSIPVACLALAAMGAMHSAPSYATTGWYFASSCQVLNPIDCPWGPDVWYFGPFNTESDCNAAHDLWQGGYFGTYPRGLSTCFPM